jgi:hypothetical protein
MYIVRMTLFDRLKFIIQELIVLLYTTAINLNIFRVQDFGNNVNRAKAKRLGQWTTRLYILLLIIALVILVLYTIVQPQALTKTFNKPVFDFYNRLRQEYGDALKCSCSSIASIYNQFVNVEPEFHQVSTYHCNVFITYVHQLTNSKRR